MHSGCNQGYFERGKERKKVERGQEREQKLKECLNSMLDIKNKFV